MQRVGVDDAPHVFAFGEHRAVPLRELLPQLRRVFADVAACVEATLARVGKRIVLCAPIGAGKPVALINEFWRRAVADPSIDLTIMTGLTLSKPRGKSELERRLVGPMAARIFGDGLQSRDFVYVGDVVAANRAAAGAKTGASGEPVNVGRGERTTLVRDSWARDQALTVHGWIYGLKDGLLRDTGFIVSASDEIDTLAAQSLNALRSRYTPS